jgi:LruC domain-containing protein
MRKIVLLFLSVVLIGGNLLLTGCEVDYYQEPEPTEGSGSSLFGDDVSVPAGFDWSTTRSVDVNVQVDDQYNGAYYYTVELFDANPLFDENANLLGKGVAKKNSNFTVKVALPTAVETLYVQQTDPTGREKVTATSLGENSTINISFAGGSTALRSASTPESFSNDLEASSVSTRSVPSNVQTSYQTPVDAIVINDETVNGSSFTLMGGASYVIRGTYTGGIKFPGTGGVSLYVEGTWNNTSETITLQNQTRFIVQDGGEFKTTRNLTINGHKFVILAVAPSGKFNENKGGQVAFNFTDNGQIVNSGLLNVHRVSLPSAAVLYNGGEMQVENFTINNANNITNDNHLVISDAVLTNGAIANNCNLFISKLSTNGTKIDLSEGSLFTVETYASAVGTTITMDSHSIMEVPKSITFGWGNKINGNGKKIALVRLKEVFFSDGGNVYSGLVQIESSNHPVNPPYNPNYTLMSPAEMVEEGKSTVTIPGNECNEGGNNDTPVGTPENPVFPIIYTGSSLTYMFEDNWPYLGDFDMNDVVLDLKPTYRLNGQNQVEVLELAMELRAVGATKRLAVGLQLDGINPGKINNITRSNTHGINGNVFRQNNGLETGQTYAVIPIFDDAHEALGLSSAKMINTTTGSRGDVRTVRFTINFDGPLNLSELTVDKLNIFLVSGGYNAKRQEIHMAGFQPTDKADKSKFGHADDNSTATTPYVAVNNMIWGLAVPGPAKYPNEWTSISNAYTYLQGWATSAGLDNKDWYQYPNEGKIFGN